MITWIVIFVCGMLCGAICAYWTAYKHAVKGQYDTAYRLGWRAGFDHQVRARESGERQREHIREERRKRNLPFISLIGSEAK